MVIAHIFLLALILLVAFYAGRYLFWVLFLKDAPTLEDAEGRLGLSNRL